MLDLNPRKLKIAAQASPILDAIDAALVASNEARRTYLGASQIGDACARRIQYEITGAPSKPHDAKTRRIFARGHTFEPLVASWLRSAGFFLSTERENGHQHGFSVAGGDFRGHADGVVVHGPKDLMTYPAVWENKALGAKSWGEVARRGVVAAKPEYADQIAIYQAYFDMPAPALFTAINGDTMDLHVELVPFDAARAQRASDRAVEIIRATKAGDILPRVSAERDAFPCSYCRFQEHCWKDA